MGRSPSWTPRVHAVPSARLCTPSASLGWCSPHTGTVLCHQGRVGMNGHSEGRGLRWQRISRSGSSLKQTLLELRFQNVKDLFRLVLFWVVQSLSANG